MHSSLQGFAGYHLHSESYPTTKRNYSLLLYNKEISHIFHQYRLGNGLVERCSAVWDPQFQKYRDLLQ